MPPRRNPLLSRTSPQPLRRWERAASLLLFSLAGLPTLWFLGGISVDVTRLYLAGQQAHEVATSAALAGSFAYSTDGLATISTSSAQRIVVQTVNIAVANKQVGLATLGSPATAATTSDVRVTLPYHVNGLLFGRLLGVSEKTDFNANGLAYLCRNQQSDNASSGQCRRPS